jgi:hypothetical protein
MVGTTASTDLGVQIFSMFYFKFRLSNVLKISVFCRVPKIAKKLSISFIKPVRPSSVHTQQFGFHWTYFHEIWYLIIFRKPVEKYQVSNIRYFTWSPIQISDHISFIFLRTKIVSKFWENQNTLFMFNTFFFENLVFFLDNVAKYCRVGQATDDNMTLAHCMLDT